MIRLLLSSVTELTSTASRLVARGAAIRHTVRMRGGTMGKR